MVTNLAQNRSNNRVNRLEALVETGIRPLGAPGDLGWVVMVNGQMYAEQYGWDRTYEALVARIVSDFDPAAGAAWIAEADGERVGSVFCVPDGEPGTARLRLLVVTPAARGLGLGSALVERCLEYARRQGYGRITLWTNDVLVSARRIYQRAGFTLVAEKPHHSFGHDLVGQDWSLDL